MVIIFYRRVYLDTISVVRCCVTDHPRTSWLKITVMCDFSWCRELAELTWDSSCGCNHWQHNWVTGAKMASPTCPGPWCCLLAGNRSSFNSLAGLSYLVVGAFQEGKDSKSRPLNLNNITSSTLNYSKQVINPVQIQEVRQQAPSLDGRRCKVLWPWFSIHHR